MPTFVKSTAPANAPAKPKREPGVKGLRSVEVKPVPVIVAALVLIAAACWFLWLGPKMEADTTAKNWTTPAAAAARAPENRPKDAKHEEMVQQLRQKEGDTRHATRSRRDE